MKKVISVLILITLMGFDFDNLAYSDIQSKEVDRLISLLSSKDKEVRKNAVKELGNLEASAAMPALYDLWEKEEEVVDERLILAIEIAMNRINLLNNKPMVRAEAAQGLGDKAELNLALESYEVEGTELFTILTLDEDDREHILFSLKKALTVEKVKQVKNGISLAIEKINMVDKDQSVRIEAIKSLAKLSHPDSLPFLGRALEKEKDEEVKKAIGKTIRVIERKQQIATVIQQLFNGVSVSSIYLLIAIGLAITFGVMGVINMAHGEFMMVGCYVAYVLQLYFKNHFSENIFWLYFFLALPLSFIITALFGLILEGTVVRLLYGRVLDTLLATWGVSLCLQQAVRQIFGANNVDVASPVWLTQGISLMAGMTLPYKRLFFIGFTALIVAGIYFLLLRTRLGLRIRAVMQNRSMSECLCIPVRKIDAFTFALGSGLAGIAGCCISLYGSVGPSTGQYYIVDCFMVVVLGGVGKIAGSIAGAFGMGETQAVFEFFTTASMGKVLLFLTIIAFLRFRPTGFSPTKGRT